MYTQSAIQGTWIAPPGKRYKNKRKLNKRKRTHSEGKQETSPMKALLRSSLIGLMLLGGYAGLAASATSSHVPGVPMPPAQFSSHVPGVPMPPSK
jgi:hypothetical protein